MEKQYFVKTNGCVPQQAVEVIGRDEREVRFFPVGGGFQYRMAASTFDASHRPVRPEEYTHLPAYAAVYDIDGMFGGLPGYSFGHRWNGWARPYFPKESCDRIVAHAGKGARYDQETDTYLIPRDEGSDAPADFETYPAQDMTVAGTRIKVWAIGSGSWTWDEECESEQPIILDPATDPNPPDVSDRESAILFVKWCIEQLALGYHPDTPFADYVGRDGQPIFTPQEAEHLDALTEKAFTFIDPVEVGVEEFERILGQGESQ